MLHCPHCSLEFTNDGEYQAHIDSRQCMDDSKEATSITNSVDIMPHGPFVMGEVNDMHDNVDTMAESESDALSAFLTLEDSAEESNVAGMPRRRSVRLMRSAVLQDVSNTETELDSSQPSSSSSNRAGSVAVDRNSGAAPVECPECRISFTNAGNLASHRRTHGRGLPHACTKCSASFSKPDALRSHQELCRADSSPSDRPVINITKRSISHLESKDGSTSRKSLHLSEVTDVSCPHCPCRFVSSRALNVHITKIHQQPHSSHFLSNLEIQPEHESRGQVGDTAPDDGGTLMTLNQLANDQCQWLQKGRRHSLGAPQFKCNTPFCNVSCMTAGALARHKQLFHGQAGSLRLACHLCAFTTKELRHLKIHYRNHTAEFFECDICTHHSMDLARVLDHRRRVHSMGVDDPSNPLRLDDEAMLVDPQFVHSCSVCRSTNLTKRGLREHYCFKPKEAVCVLCGTVFPWQGYLQVCPCICLPFYAGVNKNMPIKYFRKNKFKLRNLIRGYTYNLY